MAVSDTLRMRPPVDPPFLRNVMVTPVGVGRAWRGWTGRKAA